MKIIKDRFLKWWKRNNKNYKALLFDIDGTLIAGKNPVSGVPDLLSWLRKYKFPFFLLTNDGNHSTEEKSSILQKAGLNIDSSEIVSCGMALVPFVKRNNLSGMKFFVMGDLGKPDFAEKAGLKVIRDTKKIEDCKGVIVGEGIYDWQSNISAVLNYFIKYPGRLFLVPNPDSYWPDGKNGEIGIGAGGKARFMCIILDEYGIKLNPVYFGKPYPAIFQYTYQLLKQRFDFANKLPKNKVLVLGDSLISDIKGAKNFGFSSALTLTGITNTYHVKNINKKLKPDFIFQSIG